MRRVNLTLACLAVALCGSTGFAATYEERVVVQLRAMGYTDITVSFTMLGRAQILAVNQQQTREIVLNPRTGEILRDYAQGPAGSNDVPAPVAVQPIVLGPEVVPEVLDVPLDVPAVVVTDPVLDPGPAVDPVETGALAEETVAEPAASETAATSTPDQPSADTSTDTGSSSDTGSTTDSLGGYSGGYEVGP